MWITGCASDNDPIAAAGGSTAGTATGGSTVGAAAGGSTAGTATGGASQGSGGSSQVDNSQAQAGETAMAQGGAGQGGSSAVAGAGGLAGGATVNANCPAYRSTGGVLITPPSNDFELDIATWTTMTGKASSISRKQLANSACQGSSYLTCDGATRSGAWDGPKLMILPYLVVGHQYLVTVAARFDPENAPAAAGTLILSTVNACLDSTVSTAFKNLERTTTISDWVRLSGTVEPMLTGCSELSETTIYLETDTLTQAYSIEVDDFQLWDVTPATAG